MIFNFRSEPTPEMWKLTLVLWFYRGIRDGQTSGWYNAVTYVYNGREVCKCSSHCMTSSVYDLQNVFCGKIWFYRWVLQVIIFSSFPWLPCAKKAKDIFCLCRKEARLETREVTFDSHTLQVWMNMPLERCKDRSTAKNKLAIKSMTLHDSWQCCQNKLLPTNGDAPS